MAKFSKSTGIINLLYNHNFFRNSDGLRDEESIKKVISEAKSEQIAIVSYVINKNIVSAKNVADIMSDCYGYNVVPANFPETVASLADDRFRGIEGFELDYDVVCQFHALPIMYDKDLSGRFGLVVLMSDCSNVFDVENFYKQKYGIKRVDILIAEDPILQKCISDVFKDATDSLAGLDSEEFVLDDDPQGDDPGTLQAESDTNDDAPVVKFVNKMLMDSIKMRASDLHFEPYEKKYRVRFRIDGVLKTVATVPVSLKEKISARIKVMSRLDIAERRVPQDGRIKLKLSATKDMDMRVNTLPTLWGEKIVMRILDSSAANLDINILGYEEEQKAKYLGALSKPQGLILVTGPTGSGKTVSLYTGLSILNDEETNISTAEDPVEINLEGINQVQINTKAGLTFASALRAFLRQDPDVVMVGEIRDLETAEIAIKAAQTGHLVLSTLHTNSAPETLTRLINMGVPGFNIASSVTLIMAQRLARKLCDECKISETVPEQELLKLGYTQEDIDKGMNIYTNNPEGCSKCSGGYKGRVGIYEIFVMSERLAMMIMQGANSLEIAKAAEEEGMVPLRKSGLKKVAKGITSLQEVLRVTSG